MPGAGKSRLIPAILDRWRAERPNDSIVVMAPMRVAARLVYGETVQRKRDQLKDTLFIVDEIGMIALSTIGRLAEWQLTGAYFVLLGDFYGQLAPIHDP